MKTAIQNLMVAASLVLCASPALAESVGGAAAKPTSSGDASCASYSYGALINACTSTKTFIIAVPYTTGTSGSRNFSYAGKSVSAAADVSCKASAFVMDQSYGYTTAYASPTGTTAVESVSLGALYVTSGGQAYILCNLAAGAKIVSFTWDQ